MLPLGCEGKSHPLQDFCSLGLLLVHFSNINSPLQSSRDSGYFPSPTQYRKLSEQQKGKHLVWMIFKFVVFFIAINECQDSSHFFPLRQSMTVLLGKGQAVCVGMVFPGSYLCLPAMFGKPASALGHSSTAVLNSMNQDYAKRHFIFDHIFTFAQTDTRSAVT